MFSLVSILPLLALAAATPVRRDDNQLIYSGRDGKCISPQGGAAAVAAGKVTNGTPVVSMDCSSAATWTIVRNQAAQIVLSGTKTPFVLDAGTGKDNNEALKVWQPYPGLFQQTWWYTTDNRVAIFNGNQCMDEGTNGVQTYQCTPNNGNQVWYTKTKGTPTSSSSSSSSTPTQTGVLPNVPKGQVYPDLPGQGRRLHPYGRDDLCVTVMGGLPQSGQAVNIAYCYPNGSPYATYQLWDVPVGVGSNNRMTLHSASTLCLDAGSNPANGGLMKVWTCGGYPQQSWNNGNNDQLFQTANNQCLDVQLGSGPSGGSPYPQQGTLQTWTCSASDIQQKFHLYNGQ